MKKIFILLTAIIIGFLCGCSDDGGSSGGSSGGGTVSVPTGLRASGATSSSIKVSWNPVDGATYYNIQYNDGNGWVSEGSPTSLNKYTVEDLESYTTYSFRVRAIGSSNTSQWSSSVSGKTLIGKPDVKARKSGTTVTLIIAPVKGAASYGVSYGTTPDYTSSKFFTNARPVNGSVPDVKITGLTAGRTYYFFVNPMPALSDTTGSEYTYISVSL